jgi:homoaconitate hydratase
LIVEDRGLSGVPSDADGEGHNPRLTPERIAEVEEAGLSADSDASYATYLTLDLSTVSPHVSGPDHVKAMHSVAELSKKNVKIDKAYLVSCVNSRVEDLAAAARVIKGKKVANHVKFYIAPASNEVQAESESRGDWQTLLDAGAIALPAGCGPCIGLGEGLLEDNEVGISATNRNFKGRMGSRSAQAYLASPDVVAASAVAGKIDMPGLKEPVATIANIQIHNRAGDAPSRVSIVDGFPESITGELIFCHQDNLNTDGIYPGKYTYIDDFTPEQQAGVVMENYDPEFGKVVNEGDIVVGGFNFGTGSSREQAATALKYRGIRLVVAGSFSETYKRNALNNGFLTIEAPELSRDLKTRFGDQHLTIKTSIDATVDFVNSTIEAAGKKYAIAPVGKAAQELVVVGGLEEWVRKNL